MNTAFRLKVLRREDIMTIGQFLTACQKTNSGRLILNNFGKNSNQRMKEAFIKHFNIDPFNLPENIKKELEEWQKQPETE